MLTKILEGKELFRMPRPRRKDSIHMDFKNGDTALIRVTQCKFELQNLTNIILNYLIADM
jgi:hypothetical protein